MLVEPFNWQRLSGIGAVLTTPDGRRVRCLLALHRGGIRSAHLVRFLHALRHHRRRPVILLWDGLPAHRSRRTREALHQHRTWLRVEPLPAYAPELNPVEQLWAHLDGTTLANTAPSRGSSLAMTPITLPRRLSTRVGDPRNLAKGMGPEAENFS